MERFYRIFNKNINCYETMPVEKMFDEEHFDAQTGMSLEPYCLESYIGMTDKNGIKIFENDLIIETNRPNISYQVEIDKRFLRAVAKHYDNNQVVIGYLDMSTIRAGLVDNNLEKIGNIHDTFNFGNY